MDVDVQREKPLKAATIRALRSHGISIVLPNIYENLLRSSVFCSRSLENKKEMISFQKLLVSYESYPILQLIWKESPFVTDEELAAVGMSRSFPVGDLTRHKLAIALAAGAPERMASLNKRIGCLVRASVAYGLMNQRAVTPKKVLIEGTFDLNSFMLKISEAQDPLFAYSTVGASGSGTA